MQTILVTGATGNQGGTVARHLLKNNKFQVLALVRDINDPKAQKLQQQGARLITGDFNDRASLDRALKGVYGVFSMQDFRDGAATEIRQGTALADAAKAAGVKHFVYSSVGSAERKTGIPHFESKFTVEDHVRALGMPHTILRPVFFMYNFEGMRGMIDNGTLYMPLSPDTILQQLSEDDYGAMVATVFENPEKYYNQSIELASTELKMQEVAGTFSHVMGKKITYQQIPFEAFQQQAGEEVTTMFRWFENTGYNADLPELKKQFQPLSSFETYLRAHAWAEGQPSFIKTGDVQPLSIAGGNYRILISGEQTGGAYSVIDMQVPPEGGPVPHAHPAYQEAFYIIEGEIEITTKAKTWTAGKGDYVNIPLNGPIHQFKNRSKKDAQLLCIITPAGMEKMFIEISQAAAPVPQIAEKYGQQLFPPDYFSPKP
jgi:uncharacterized protein YbjT (DUF2867 family)/quercetin dioxygenase-like cupin family protein